MWFHVTEAVGTYMSWWSAGGFGLKPVIEYARACMIVWAESKVQG